MLGGRMTAVGTIHLSHLLCHYESAAPPRQTEKSTPDKQLANI